MKPDPRLLLLVSSLPFVPGGSRRVLRCNACGQPPTHYSGCDSPDAGDPCTEPSGCRGKAVWLVDLSEPEKRDGLPVWLDVLPWALEVLGWHGPICVYPDRKCVSFDWSGRRTVYLDGDWPDLSGLTPAQQTRAVVAAALSRETT